MSMRTSIWAFAIRDLSPLAKLVAIALAEGSFDERGVGSVSSIWLNEWCCAEQVQIDAALDELGELGLRWHRQGDRVVCRFPAMPLRASTPPSEGSLFIYVFASAGRSKVGISGDPKARLYNLQGGSPSIPITQEFAQIGPERAIRNAERLAHEWLFRFALGREWFAVEPPTAIEVVKGALREVGVTA